MTNRKVFSESNIIQNFMIHLMVSIIIQTVHYLILNKRATILILLLNFLINSFAVGPSNRILYHTTYACTSEKISLCQSCSKRIDSLAYAPSISISRHSLLGTVLRLLPNKSKRKRKNRDNERGEIDHRSLD